MAVHQLFKFGIAITCGGATLSIFQDDLKKSCEKFLTKHSVFATTVVNSNWNDNWDKRAHAKPTATRHIILIRHGQYNLNGKTDAEKYLTTLGKEQSKLTGIRLKELGLDKKITLVAESTMTRAMETNKIICEELGFSNNNTVSIETTEWLCEGAPVEPDPPTPHWTPESQSFFVDGSRIETAFRRFFHRADPDQKHDTVELIVCHANVIRYFVCRALQLPPEAWLRISLRHASITQLSIRPNGRVSLKALGDSGHLPADKLSFE